MTASASGYRPSVIFVVTMVMLLVALVGFVIFFQYVGEAKAQQADANDKLVLMEAAKAEIEKVQAELAPLKAPGLAEALQRVGELQGIVEELGNRAPPTVDTSAVEASVAKIEQRLAALEGYRNTHGTGAHPDTTSLVARIDGLQERLGSIERSGSGSPTRTVPTSVQGDITDLKRQTLELRTRLAPIEKQLVELPKATLDQLPLGTILPWDPRLRDPQGRLLGGERDLPDGWAYCDGKNGDLPDLAGRFLRGTGPRDEVGKSGGRPDIPDTEAHWHHSSTPPAIRQSLVLIQGAPHPNQNTYYFSANGHRHDHGGMNLPPYMTVRYIIKLR